LLGRYFKTFVILIFISTFLLPAKSSFATHMDSLNAVDKNSVQQGESATEPWRIHNGDNMKWAEVEYVDSTWTIISPKFGHTGISMDK
jgi:hypothetical protein